MVQPRSLLVLAAALLILPAPAEADDKAEGQASFARRELTDGNFTEALRLAEGALRADATFHEALLLKALAYEGLGDIDLAEAYLFAYQEEARLAELPHPARQLMERLALARKAQRPTPEIRPEQNPWQDQEIDPAPYRDRCQAALKRGSCRAATAAATELVRAEPRVAEGFRLLGDAARCHDQRRDAAVAYQRYFDLGGQEQSVRDLHSDLLAGLGTLEVSVRLPDSSVLPTGVLEMQDKDLPLSDQDGTTLRFVAIPTGERLTLRVAGLGLRAERKPLTPFSAGETRRVEIAPEVIGLGTLVVGPFDEQEAIVRLETADQTVDVVSEERRELTAGDFTITVFSDHGGVTLEQRVKPGGTVEFDPSRHLPAGLTIARLPAGAKVTVIAESRSGVFVETERNLPLDRGRIDSTSGLRLVPSTQVDSLVGGTAGVWVTHPVLGPFNRDVILENGAWTGIEWQADHMEGADEIKQAWEAWQTAGANKSKRLTAGAVVTGVLAGALVGTGAGLMGGYHQARVSEADAIGRLAGGGVQEWEAVRDEARRDQTGFLVSGIGSFALGLASAALSVNFGVRGEKATRVDGAWEPWNIGQEETVE